MNKKVDIKDIRVFVCVPGVGKTYLGKNDDRFIDLDREKVIYKYGYPHDIDDRILEEAKGGYHHISAKADPLEYIRGRIHEVISSGKIVLLAPNPKTIQLLLEENLPYCLVYHSLDSNEEICQRLKARGNRDNFVKGMFEGMNNFYKNNNEDTIPTYKIELQRGEYLSNKLQEIFKKA